MNSTPPTPALSLKRLTKRFLDLSGVETPAIEDVTLDVGAGEFVVVTGPSGCGKTTLVNLIAGFERPTSGTVVVNVTSNGANAAGPVVMFQDLALFDWMSVRDNVAFGLKARGISRRARRSVADRFLAKVDLLDVGDRYPYELSGGMKQRVALARALVVQPPCLLLDEPLSRLDHRLRLSLQDELLRLWQETGATVMFVTHDAAEAVYLADRVIVLSPAPGRIEQILSIELPRPRAPRDRLSEQFVTLERTLRDALASRHRGDQPCHRNQTS